MNLLGDRVLELGPKADADSPYRNFKLTRDADGVAWLLFDREGTSANTLSADLIEELDKVLAELESQRPTGLVIRSAKTSGFIAGEAMGRFAKDRWDCDYDAYVSLESTASPDASAQRMGG